MTSVYKLRFSLSSDEQLLNNPVAEGSRRFDYHEFYLLVIGFMEDSKNAAWSRDLLEWYNQ